MFYLNTKIRNPSSKTYIRIPTGSISKVDLPELE